MSSDGERRDKPGDESAEELAVARTIPSDAKMAETLHASSPNAASQADADRELLGGRYEVLGLLGRGAEGVVYRARDVKADAVVALKLLPHSDGSDERLQRFRRELQLARKVTHPNVVRIHDLVELPGQFGLSMELVEGESLDRRIARGRATRAELVSLALDLARALAAAHSANVLHRDLKPGNVLLRRRDGSAVVSDFGVSRALEDRDAPLSAAGDERAVRLTSTGAIIGTPLYMAPEQLDGRSDVGPAADVFAFGLVLFEAATGRRLHDAPTLGELRRLRRESSAPPLRRERPDLPRALCTAVDRALSAEPGRRFASGVELLAALERLAPSRSHMRSWMPLAIGVIGVGAAAAAVVHFAGRHPGAAAPASSASARTVFSMHVSDDRRRITHGECEENPDLTADGRTVLFDGTVGPDSFIFRVDVEGGDPVQLTHVEGWDLFPQVSPDGSRFVFSRGASSGNGVYIAALDGHEPPRRIGDVRSVAATWTRDGRGLWIVLDSEVLELDADTGNVRRRLPVPGRPLAGVAFETPDGVVLAYLGFASDSSDSVLGAFAGAEGALRTLLHASISGAALTPRGQEIIAAVSRADTQVELLDVPVDGSPAVEIPASGLSPRGGMAFSRDGKRVVWSTCGGHWLPSLVDTTGRFSPYLQEDGETVSVAPIGQGKEMAIVSTRTGKRQPWIIDRSGARPPRALPVGAVEPNEIAVSNDGTRVALTWQGHGIFVAPVDGSVGPVQVSTDASDSMPAFRFGDQQVVFTRRSEDGTLRLLSVSVGGGDPVLLIDGASDAASSHVSDRLVYLAGRDHAAVPEIWDGLRASSRPLAPGLTADTYDTPRFSPDGRRVVLIRGLDTLVEVDVASGVVLRSLRSERAQLLRDPSYADGGIAVLRKTWTGNLWAADLVH